MEAHTHHAQFLIISCSDVSVNVCDIIFWELMIIEAFDPSHSSFLDRKHFCLRNRFICDSIIVVVNVVVVVVNVVVNVVVVKEQKVFVSRVNISATFRIFDVKVYKISYHFTTVTYLMTFSKE